MYENESTMYKKQILLILNNVFKFKIIRELKIASYDEYKLLHILNLIDAHYGD
jgi:hypothetical protein